MVAEPLIEVSGARSSWTHHAHELPPQAFQFLNRRQVLDGDDLRHDGPVGGTDRRCIDQKGGLASVGDRDHDLLAAHRFVLCQLGWQWGLAEEKLAPVGAADADHLEQLLGRAARHAQPLDEALGFLIERQRIAGPGVEDQHADRRGLDQGLEMGTHALRAEVGNGRLSLRGDQQQEPLVLAGELGPVCLLREKEVGEVRAALTDRCRQKGFRQGRVRDQAERAGIGGEVGEPQRFRSAAHLLDEAASGLFGETRSHEVPGLPGLAEGRDGAVAGAGHPTGAFQRLPQDGCEIGTFADPQVDLSQPGDARA